MPHVFINFRSCDEPSAAVLLKRELSVHFGEEQVFLARSTIPPGDDFQQGLLEGVRRSAVLLAVVGRRWATAENSDGDRLVDLEDDWVRREIAEAFRSGIRVVPVLVGDVERLTRVTLPEDIEQLTRCQYLRLRYDSTEQDLARISGKLAELVPVLRKVEPERRPASERAISIGGNNSGIVSTGDGTLNIQRR